eukprot:COSAG02_NODE_12783_length_1495_cov_1.368195_3_plen_208_part_00
MLADIRAPNTESHRPGTAERNATVSHALRDSECSAHAAQSSQTVACYAQADFECGALGCHRSAPPGNQLQTAICTVTAEDCPVSIVPPRLAVPPSPLRPPQFLDMSPCMCAIAGMQACVRDCARCAEPPPCNGLRKGQLRVFCCIYRFYNPNGDYDTAEKEELAEECKTSGEDEVIQERPVIAKFLVRTLAVISFCPAVWRRLISGI